MIRTKTKIENKRSIVKKTLCPSKWLKDAIRFNSMRNEMDAYRDVEKLFVFVRQRVDESFNCLKG